MKTKALSLTLAGLMSLQSVSFASADRTDGIGDQAIFNAKGNLSSLNREILQLDQSLAKAAEAITARDNKGGTANGIAMAGAGLGLGLSALAYLNMQKGGEGKLFGVLLVGVLSIGTTVSSLISGVTSKTLKPGADTKAIEAQLAEAQKTVQAAIVQAANDKTTSMVLTQLSLAIKNTQKSLISYQDQETEVSRNRLVSQASQLIGSALIVYGITQSESRAPMIGALLMNVGNLGAFLSGLQDSEAEAVLKEIQSTRESLKIASATLQ